MTGDGKDTTIRLPAQLHHGGVFRPRWTAELTLPNGLLGTRFTSTGITQADARAQLTELVAATVGLLEEGPILVIGGDSQYAGHTHLIHAQPGGWVVASIRSGQ